MADSPGAARSATISKFGSFVIGAEADTQWADTKQDQDVAFVPAAGFAGTFVPGAFESNSAEWWASVRARLGVAIDRVLIYGTGGLAYTEASRGIVPLRDDPREVHLTGMPKEGLALCTLGGFYRPEFPIAGCNCACEKAVNGFASGCSTAATQRSGTRCSSAL